MSSEADSFYVWYNNIAEEVMKWKIVMKQLVCCCASLYRKNMPTTFCNTQAEICIPCPCLHESNPFMECI